MIKLITTHYATAWDVALVGGGTELLLFSIKYAIGLHDSECIFLEVIFF